MIKPDYMGDGVYIADEGYGLNFRLMTNHHEHPTDEIFIDEYVFDAILRYRERMKQDRVEADRNYGSKLPPNK